MILFNRSLVSELHHSSDSEGGTCTRSTVAKCQKKYSRGTQPEIVRETNRQNYLFI